MSDSGYSTDEEREELVEVIEDVKNKFSFLRLLCYIHQDLEIASQYKDGYEICERYLDDKICLPCFVAMIHTTGLIYHLYPWKEYFPEELCDFLSQCEESGTPELVKCEFNKNNV